MKYLPFLDGKYSTAPGLNNLSKAGNEGDRLIFQLDEQYLAYLANKRNCRAEDPHKYYWESCLSDDTITNVNKLIVRQLTTEYPDDFTLTAEGPQVKFHNKRTGEQLQWKDDWRNIQHDSYLSLFDALGSQVQEDLAICQLQDDRDWLAAIHLSSPNHWSPEEKIGKPFSAVHGVVPGMEKLNQQYFRMLVTAVQKGPFARFAWGLSTDDRLNHHPEPPPGTDPAEWQGRRMEAGDGNIFLRVERQTLTGLPSCNAFLFTIRTYFYAMDSLDAEELSALYSAIRSMSPQSLAYKGIPAAFVASLPQ